MRKKVLLKDLQAEEQKAIAIMQNTMRDHEVKMKLLEEEIADVQEKVSVSFSGGTLFTCYLHLNPRLFCVCTLYWTLAQQTSQYYGQQNLSRSVNMKER